MNTMSALGSTDNIENLSERRELSEAAKALLADKAFNYAYLQLRKLWFAELMLQPHAGVKQDELAAKLRALNALADELSAEIENYRQDARTAAEKARHG
jgi:hypothetical protein